MSDRAFVAGVVTVMVVIVTAIAAGCGYAGYQTTLKKGEVEFTMRSKERITDVWGSKYLVFSTEGEAYEVTDNILFGLIESSNRYADLTAGATYRCSTIGVRWPLFNTYKNLRHCVEIEPSARGYPPPRRRLGTHPLWGISPSAQGKEESDA
ncbi:MAG TPA: hypothetical protein VFU11_05300 [Solirubrobacterales bacterium]|nr:hypothetical protein [Solirubrobacterales bacterium]